MHIPGFTYPVETLYLEDALELTGIEPHQVVISCNHTAASARFADRGTRLCRSNAARHPCWIVLVGVMLRGTPAARSCWSRLLLLLMLRSR